jgi:phage head maturation protease
LEISKKAVDLSRLGTIGIPLLDSHQQIGISNSIGKLRGAWIDGKALIGEIAFHATPEGRKAEGMVSRGEINGVSAGYRVDDWEITNEDGDVIDPDKDKIQWDDELTFTAKRWMLHEVSLVSVAADATAQFRSVGGKPASPESTRDVRTRMLTRQRMMERSLKHYIDESDAEISDDYDILTALHRMNDDDRMAAFQLLPDSDCERLVGLIPYWRAMYEMSDDEVMQWFGEMNG